MEVNKMLLQHFREPQNAGYLAETLAVGTGIAYQDTESVLQLQICVAQDNIVDARFKASGCYAVIAVGSWLASRLPGMTLVAAQAVSPTEMINALALPAHKNYSAWLGQTALKMAIEQYYSKQKAGE